MPSQTQTSSQMSSQTISAADGTKLHIEWMPSQKKLPLLLYIHGQGSYRGSGRHLGTHFTKLGYGYAALDLRGHGKSDGDACFVESFHDYHQDILAAITFLTKKGMKIIPIGHSMGALAVWGTLEKISDKEKKNIQGVVLSSPAVQLNFTPSRVSVTLAHIFKYFPILKKMHFVTGIDAQKATHDAKEQQWLLQDKDVKDFITPSLFFSFLKEMERALEPQVKYDFPLLVLWGTQDHTINPAKMAEFGLKLGRNGNNVTKKTYPGLYHSLFLETEREKIFEDIHHWLQKLN